MTKYVVCEDPDMRVKKLMITRKSVEEIRSWFVNKTPVDTPIGPGVVAEYSEMADPQERDVVRIYFRLEPIGATA